MPKEIWINLPVKDVKRSKEFFNEIGFTLHPRHIDDEQMASVIIGGVNIMLFNEMMFQGFTRNSIADTKSGTEVLLSVDAQSREEVDELMRRVVQAGGSVYAEPGENQGWMYGAGFADPDGHRWNVLYMDMEKMPK